MEAFKYHKRTSGARAIYNNLKRTYEQNKKIVSKI